MYLMENSLLSPKQSGFRKNYGIYDPTIDLVSFIHNSFNQRLNVLCIYIDMAKAFNSLDVNILLEKLYSLGFEGKELELLKSYSTQRKQITIFDGMVSSSGTVEYGVAQGSVLGPLLFSIYFNDLPNIFNKLQIRMYADDAVLYSAFDGSAKLDEFIAEVNAELDLFSIWCRANLLTVNTSKTKCMVFRPQRMRNDDQLTPVQGNLYLNDSKLEFVSHYRYLGIELDCQWKMEKHVEKTIGKVRPLLYTLAKVKHYVDCQTGLAIFKAYILPMLEFGLYLIDNHVLIDKLQKLQNKALRICFEENNCSPSYPLHCKSNLLSLDLRRVCSLLNFINLKLIKGEGTFAYDTRQGNRSEAVEVG